MQLALDHIAAAQARFGTHRLFVRMAEARGARELLPLVEGLAPWVLAFHDLLEIVEERMQAPAYRRLAHHHHLEEGGHDRWYLADLRRLGLPLPDGPALYGRSHAGVRLASHALLAEALTAESDEERLVLLLALEATGAEFFEAAARSPAWGRSDLQFFSGHHLEVEQAHELFEAERREWVRAQPLPPERRAATLAMIDRVFSAFALMFDALEARFARPAAVLALHAGA